MSDERIVLSKEQALSMLGDGDEIHTFRTPGMGIISSTWEPSWRAIRHDANGIEQSTLDNLEIS